MSGKLYLLFRTVCTPEPRGAGFRNRYVGLRTGQAVRQAEGLAVRMLREQWHTWPALVRSQVPSCRTPSRHQLYCRTQRLKCPRLSQWPAPRIPTRNRLRSALLMREPRGIFLPASTCEFLSWHGLKRSRPSPGREGAAYPIKSNQHANLIADSKALRLCGTRFISQFDGSKLAAGP
jgi:hypothetical protein